MDFIAAIFSSFLSIIFFFLFVALVLKAFQIATTLGEIKEVLEQQKRSADLASLPAVVAAPRAAAQPAARPFEAPQPTTWSSAQAFAPATGNAIPMTGEAMLRALDLEMRMEAAGKTPSIVDTTVAGEPAAASPQLQAD